MDGDIDPVLKVSSEYTVQLPHPDIIEEVIPTPPLAPELNLRFSQRNTQVQPMNVEMRAVNLAKLKDLDGKSQVAHNNSFDAFLILNYFVELLKWVY